MTMTKALLAVLTLLSLASDTNGCRSNTTHVAWSEEESSIASISRNLGKRTCFYEHRVKTAQTDALAYLRKNVMAFDRENIETLGFTGDSDDDVDGLGNGIVGPSVTLAFEAKQNYTWTDKLCKYMFYEYVLNYANLNEARTNWRPLLLKTVRPLMEAHKPKDIGEVVSMLNKLIWTELAPRHSESIVFVSGQTPLIYDPMSIMAFGYASCTGLAILFVDILRTAGVPARVAGTPSW